MNPLEEAYIPESEYELIRADVVKKWREGVPEFRNAFPGATDETIEQLVREFVDRERDMEQWRNETYQVGFRRHPEGLVVLSIKRNDREPCNDWRDFQAIKNQLVGPECEAVQLYPAESRLVDSSNQYWLWCVSDPAYRFPFGFTERLVNDGSVTVGKSKQRPI